MTVAALDLAELLDTASSVGDVAVRPSSAVVAAAGGGVAYDGSRATEKLALWQPYLNSADADLLPEKAMLDARSRDMMRNDAYAAGGATIHKDSIVGSWFRLNAKPQTKVLFGKDDDTWETEFAEEVETKFTLWGESPECWPDAARRKTVTDIVRLGIGVHTSGGEVLMRSMWMPDDGRPFRTATQMIDADRLSTPYNQVSDPTIRAGVEQDRYGAPVAYHIRVRHPSDLASLLGRPEDLYAWKRVPARKPWGRAVVLHVYEEMRVDQSRGVAALVTALSEMRMTKHFRKTELERAVVAATYAASIESDLPHGEIYKSMGAMNSEPGDPNAMMDVIGQYLAALNEYTANGKNVHMNGAKIPIFMPGTRLRIQNPGAQSPMGDKLEQSLLRHIAVALGISYEELSKDYTQTNYSSARAAMAQTWLAMQAKKKLVADKIANFQYRLWLEEAINANSLETLKRPRAPRFYEGLNAEAYCSCEWIGAGRPAIDPMKEAQADLLDLKMGVTTKEAIIARRSGGDWRAVAKQRKRELAYDTLLEVPSVHTDADTQQMENSTTGAPKEPSE